MKIRRKGFFWSGIGVGLFLILSYFWKFEVDGGGNFVVRDSLLGIMIFHNVFVLALYILIVVVLIVRGLVNKVIIR